MNLKEAENFLKEVKKISSQIPKQEKTFMEISGYPYYENSYSNILAFYFNPKEEHGLNDIMLKSLLEIVKEKNNKLKTNVNLSNTSVFREYTTELGNRIDLVLQNDEKGIDNIVCLGAVFDVDVCAGKRYLHKYMAVRNKLRLPVFVNRHEGEIQPKSLDDGNRPFVQDKA